MEEQHGHRVSDPMLFPPLVDSANAIKHRFNRAQHRPSNRVVKR
jgi:hypothetical protein